MTLLRRLEYDAAGTAWNHSWVYVDFCRELHFDSLGKYVYVSGNAIYLVTIWAMPVLIAVTFHEAATLRLVLSALEQKSRYLSVSFGASGWSNRPAPESSLFSLSHVTGALHVFLPKP